MPKRTDITSILVIGSGPIVIGQACEFDYSGVQACRVLKEEGFRVILANSNPATIMTDPEFADATYIEPLDLGVLRAIIAKERPDALLPTLGGQTALNLAMELAEADVLEHYDVELIGARREAIEAAENREMFKMAMSRIGLDTPRSILVHSMDQVNAVLDEIAFPLMLRPSYILGGAGTGIANDKPEFFEMLSVGLDISPVSEVLVEESIAGWKEFELEVMRDHADNAIIVCSIENFDAMGVHTGDSITVAPAQTLTDMEYQRMRDAAFRCIREIGVETGGSNIQFALNPSDGRMVVIEMNPRVSRSSALASKATGYPIAKIATKLAIGYTLDEISNDITKLTPASFEPTIDYVVTKIPRWVFEKFPGATDTLGTRMQSVGEVMGVGRTFAESLQKAIRSLERSRAGLNCDVGEKTLEALDLYGLIDAVKRPTPDRIFQLAAALRRGASIEELHDATKIDPWFLAQLERITSYRIFLEEKYGQRSIEELSDRDLLEAKRLGYSDAQIGFIFSESEEKVTNLRRSRSILPVFKSVDTCSAEFEAYTPYFYSTYEEESEVTSATRPRVIILGSGPNRIGQGIEFDYCCVHACFALGEAGFDTVMVNCNPETVSTDYDTSTRLYVEPLSIEEVGEIINAERNLPGELVGVIVSLGGQTPLRLAGELERALILGTSPDAIDIAEDRKRWSELCSRLGIPQPAGATVTSLSEAREVASRIGFPILVRPSYVLGGRAMEIAYDMDQLVACFERLKELDAEGSRSSNGPILIDKFLEDAIEVDVDALRDRVGEVYIGGVMEHVEEAGVHSGDSACTLPPQSLSKETVERIEAHVEAIANELGVIGLLNVQFAVKSDQIFVIEANPRASRTVPFVAKATGVPLAKLAALLMVGKTLGELAEEKMFVPPLRLGHVAVKEAVLPFSRFPLADTLLGPEMRSTGEVMGIDSNFPLAFAKSQVAAGSKLPMEGMVFLSLANRDKEAGLEVAHSLSGLGFTLCATSGTAEYFENHGLEVTLRVSKVGADISEEPEALLVSSQASQGGSYVDAVELIASKKVSLVINTPRGSGPRVDGYHIRTAAQRHQIPCITTLAAAKAVAQGIAEMKKSPLQVRSLQSFHGDLHY